MAARRIRVRPAVLDHLTGTIGATAKLPPARGRSGSRVLVQRTAPQPASCGATRLKPCGLVIARRKRAKIRSMPASRRHSVMMRSAHSTSETKIAGLPNFAPHWARSASVTPRAREHAPQAKI